MNRPRSRKPRGPRNIQARPPATPQQAAGAVPTAEQVVPGTSVFIVLKEDQPSGRETAGTVRDVLTRGNHPRGIKVRLRDGQVGRVQRMGDGPAAGETTASGTWTAGSSGWGRRYADVRTELDGPDELPARSLADFMPAVEDGAESSAGEDTGGLACPICEAFRGDEAAVTYHVEREHYAASP